MEIIIGVVIGIVLTLLVFRVKRIGMLGMIDDPDSGEPYFFLELEKQPTHVAGRKYVILKIHRISQK